MTGLIGLALISVLAVILFRTPRAPQKPQTPAPNRISPFPDPRGDKMRPLNEQESAQLDNAAASFLALYREGLVGTCTDEVPDLTDTRVGGPKAWPVGKPFPTDTQGRQLLQLVQINMSDLPQITGLPKTGTLQVFIADDDLLGCAFPSTNGDGFLIVLHDADCRFEVVPESATGEGCTPIYKSEIAQHGRKIRWEKKEVPPTAWDYRLNNPYQGNQPWPANVEHLYEEFLNEQADARGPYDVMLLGHPDFTQEDIRYDPQYRGLENLIGFSSSGGAFMWGDLGEACVLLPPDAFRSLDLSKALYFYDCS